MDEVHSRMMSSPGFRTGKGFRRAASTRLRIAAFAPTPTVSESVLPCLTAASAYAEIVWSEIV
jgi:hypothetical protein